MASLGWLLNLGFAGSGPGAPVGPFVGSLLLLGVGRMWWLPVVWPMLTGRAYAGEMEGVVEFVEPVVSFVAGALASYGAVLWRDWLRTKRRRAVRAELQKIRDEENRGHAPSAVGKTQGSAIPMTCAACGKSVSTFLVLTDGSVRCEGCC